MGVGLIAGAIDAAIQYNNTGEVDVAQSLTVATIATGGAALGAGILALTGVITVTAGATAVAATTTASTVGTAVMADGDPTNEVNAILDTANSACGGDYCASETESLFRAVSQSEADDILVNHLFRPKPGGFSMESKWFWRNFDSAGAYLTKFPDYAGIIKVQVQESILNYGFSDPFLDRIGPAINFSYENLSILNEAIVNITFIPK